MDAQGTEVARRFTESAGAKFTTAIDRAQGLWELYGFNVVPNGFFVDEHGVLRYMKIGGFDVRNAEDAQAIERLLASPPSFRGAGSNAAPKTETLEEAVEKALEDWRKDRLNLDRLLTLAERRAEAKQYAHARHDFQGVRWNRKKLSNRSAIKTPWCGSPRDAEWSPPWASRTWRWAVLRNSGGSRASGRRRTCWWARSTPA